MQIKHTIIRPIALFAILATALSGCTKNFKSYNTDPNGIPNTNTQVATLLIPTEQEIMYMADDEYQIGQNLNADIYAGYSMPDQTFGQALDNANYVFIDFWNVEAFNSIYTNLIGPIKNNFGKIENLENKSGVALKDFKQAVAADRAANNIQDLSVSYLNIAKFYINHQYPDSAIFYARQALDIATKGNFKPDILNASQELYTYYKMANNLPLTLQYLELTTATKDSLFSQDKEKQLLSLDFNEQIRQQQ